MMTAMDWLNALWVLAKDVGKGGGGSTEEPTVCMVLLPIGVAVGLAILGDARRELGKLRVRLEAERSLGRSSPERKVQTA